MKLKLYQLLPSEQNQIKRDFSDFSIAQKGLVTGILLQICPTPLHNENVSHWCEILATLFSRFLVTRMCLYENTIVFRAVAEDLLLNFIDSVVHVQTDPEKIEIGHVGIY